MTTGAAEGAAEPHAGSTAGRLNWLRAGVLGANDGIVSVAAIVVGVASATPDFATLLNAGLAALVGGAISMALGEYVSVSSQSDSQKALIATERRELAEDPEGELAELTSLYEARGLSRSTAELVARELTDKDPLRAHLETELGLTEDEVVSPWHAAGASAIAFLCGGVLPLVAILLLPGSVRIVGTFVIVLVALAITGALGARLGGSPTGRAAIRVVVGGAAALVATIVIGSLFRATGV
ncbi:MAG: VIT1/CCC1 transporter family protein [Amnibacterium sp.]